jgi:hypothetical protein
MITSFCSLFRCIAYYYSAVVIVQFLCFLMLYVKTQKLYEFIIFVFFLFSFSFYFYFSSRNT